MSEDPLSFPWLEENIGRILGGPSSMREVKGHPLNKLAKAIRVLSEDPGTTDYDVATVLWDVYDVARKFGQQEARRKALSQAITQNSVEGRRLHDEWFKEVTK